MDKIMKLIPQTVAPKGITFVEQAGTVTGLRVIYDVNFGKTSSQINPDVWDELTDQDKAVVQKVFDRCKGIGTEIVQASQ